MKIKYIVALMTVIATAGGCTQDTGEQPEEAVPIRLAATIAPTDAGKTRAFGVWGGAATTQDTELLTGQTVRAWISENDGLHTAAIKDPIEYTVSNAAGDLEPVNTTTDPAFYYPQGVDVISIHAIHPSGYASGGTFTVNTDQTTEANYAASDLCYSMPANFARTDVDANGRKLLQMKHLLSKIVVNLTLDPNVTSATLPTSIKLHAKTSTTMTFPVASSTDANCYTGCTASDASNPGIITMKQEAIIPPQEIAAGASFISLTVPGIGPMIYPMPTATSFESGKKYTYNLKVTDVGITATTNVTDWGTKVANQQVMGKKLYTIVRNQANNPLYYVLDKDLNSNATALVAATNCNASVYFNTWTNAMTTLVGNTTSRTGYNSTSTKTIDGIKLVFPTTQMWLSIVPVCWGTSGTGRYNYNMFVEGTTTSGVTPCKGSTYGVWTENASCFKQAQTATAYKSYWSGKIEGTDSYHPTRYAIRYIGTNYCSIWKYTNEGTYGGGGTSDFRLVIRSQLISSPAYPTLTTNTNFGSTADEKALLQLIIDRLESGDYDWEDSNSYEERAFYALGIGTGSGATWESKGEYVTYYVAASNDDPRSDYTSYTSITLGAGFTSIDSGWSNNRYRPVRMFRDN